MSNQGDGQPPENTGSPQGASGGQWTGGQQQWSSGQQPWVTGGQEAQPPSWSTGETGPNVGPTMNNPQSAYYDRFSEASGEGITGPQRGGGNGGGRGKVLIGLAAALAVVVAAVAIFAFTRGDNSPKKATGTSSSGAALAPVKATTWVNPTLAAGARALKDGWVTQTSPKLPGQYDVPKSKDWKVASNSYLIYYPGKGDEIITAAGAITQYHLGFCKSDKDSSLAFFGLRNVSKSDPEKVGREQAEKFAKGIAIGPKGSKGVTPGKVSAPKKIKVDQGTIPALEYTVTTESGQPTACDKGKKYEIRTISFSAAGTSYQLVAVRLLGVDNALPTAKLDEVISTFRPNS